MTANKLTILELSKPRPQLGDAVIGQPITVVPHSLPNLVVLMSLTFAPCRLHSPGLVLDRPPRHLTAPQASPAVNLPYHNCTPRPSPLETHASFNQI
ncbi:hypothetical protein Y032_0024g1022 [Ancylostoma ceylanicum]|uniref:Uncharacterized protein n=1 Tax=Ancylostoma ceylanicum TaxID=53326 RepID=A0A016UXX2_9BILA|nr:hypothetical protein Y032_0024g1022 [Ancylostoma ceylanicum]